MLLTMGLSPYARDLAEELVAAELAEPACMHIKICNFSHEHACMNIKILKFSHEVPSQG